MTNTPPLPPAGSTPQPQLPVPIGLDDDLRVSTGLPWQKERRFPAWLFSFALHFVTMAVLSFTLKGSPRGIVGGESSRGGGIAIASVASSGSTQYQFEESSTDATAQNTSGSPSATKQENAFPDASEAPAGAASSAANTAEGIAVHSRVQSRAQKVVQAGRAMVGLLHRVANQELAMAAGSKPKSLA